MTLTIDPDQNALLGSHEDQIVRSRGETDNQIKTTNTWLLDVLEFRTIRKRLHADPVRSIIPRLTDRHSQKPNVQTLYLGTGGKNYCHVILVPTNQSSSSIGVVVSGYVLLNVTSTSVSASIACSWEIQWWYGMGSLLLSGGHHKSHYTSP